VLHAHDRICQATPIESDNSNSFFQFLVLHESRFGARHASKDSAERGKFSVLHKKILDGFIRGLAGDILTHNRPHC